MRQLLQIALVTLVMCIYGLAFGQEQPYALFNEKHYTVTSADIVLYRVWGGGTRPEGRFFSFTPPQARTDARDKLALFPENTATHYDVVTVKKGTPIEVSIAKDQNLSNDSRQRPGGAIQVKIEWEHLKNVIVTERKPVPRDNVPGQARLFGKFDPTTYKPKSYQEAWAVYRQTSSTQPAGTRANHVAPRFTTEKSNISQTAKTYGRFPGGVLLEANAQIVGSMLRKLEYIKQTNRFRVNDKYEYDPDLTQEELGILYHFVSNAQDRIHFGATNHDKFHGVSEDSVVALWLGIADSELGAYSYGLDLGLEIFHPPATLKYSNPELLRLSQIAEMNLAAIRGHVRYEYIDDLHPRFFLQSRGVVFRMAAAKLLVESHSIDINFQVFREKPGAESALEFSADKASQVSPFVANSVKWVANNLQAVLKTSPAISRAVRYGEVLALFRQAADHNIQMANADELKKAYTRRTSLRPASDVVAKYGDEYITYLRATMLLLEAKYRARSNALNPLDRLAVLAQLMTLAAGSADAYQLARYRKEAGSLVTAARKHNDKSAPSSKWRAEEFDKLERYLGVRGQEANATRQPDVPKVRRSVVPSFKPFPGSARNPSTVVGAPRKMKRFDRAVKCAVDWSGKVTCSR